MNRFPKLMQHIVKLNILGSDLIKTHRALTNLNTRNLDAVYKEQEHRIEEFEKNEIKKSILLRKQAWKELNLYIENSKYPIDVIVTPPKVWFDDVNSNKEINIYNELLLSLSSKNINRKCNLFNFLKNDYSPDLYVDGVHLSNKGHELWSKKIYECINL